MNRYEVRGIFARGAQASLYKAIDLFSGEACVLKVGESSHDEAYLSQELNHPFIVRPIDIGIHPDLGKFATYPELSEPSFFSWMHRKPRPENLVRVVLQISEFLAYLHSRGLLYNDFKPGHFLIGEQQIQVIDLGLCSRIQQESRSETFTGTFPYISPERMAGRPSDERSDIFALGMMLLHAFIPDEPWNFAPSMSTLENLQSRYKEINSPWREIISEMTSLEPTQRIASGAELWKKLLPPSSKKAFLFFPLSIPVELPADLLNCPVTFLKSASVLSLKGARSQALLQAWRAGFTAFSIDFRKTRLENCFCSILQALTGKPSTHFIAAVNELEKLKSTEPVLLILTYTEILDARQRALLKFAMTSLSQSSSIHFLLLTTEGKPGAWGGLFPQINLPSLNRQAVELIARGLFPSDAGSIAKTEAILVRSFSSPEQILQELKRQLPVRAISFWPAAAKDTVDSSAVLDRLGPAERKLLLLLAAAGGVLKQELIAAFFKRNPQDTFKLLNHLEKEGMLYRGDQDIQILIPVNEVLRRYRRTQVRKLTGNLIERYKKRLDWLSLYHLSRSSGNTRLAACAALRVYRSQRATNGPSQSFSWVWNSIQSGATIPSPLLYRMVRSFLRNGEYRKARKLLSLLREKSGLSFQLADFYIHYFHRRNLLESARKMAEGIVTKASESGNLEVANYFSVRLAGLLILQHKLDDGEKILNGLREARLTTKTRGLLHHFYGLSYFYRGKISESVQENRKALSFRHPFHSSSLMNLGSAYAQIANWRKAKHYLERSIQKFTKHADADRLFHAYNNLGIVFKETGELKVARDYYFRSIYLARLCENVPAYLFALDNLANTYELEGRTNRAISLHKKGLRAAKSGKLNRWVGVALTNLGLQYAYQGNFTLSLSTLRKAVDIKKTLANDVSLANTYEYVGLAHFFAGHFSKAHYSLHRAGRFFSVGGCHSDANRTWIDQSVRFWYTLRLLSRSVIASGRHHGSMTG